MGPQVQFPPSDHVHPNSRRVLTEAPGAKSKPAPATLSGLSSRDSEPRDIFKLGAGESENLTLQQYSAKSTQLSLSARFEALRAKFQEAASENDAGGATQIQSQQLSFDFFAESREEQLTLFRERSGAVADSLEGAQRESFAASSRRVEVRFSLSLNVSDVVLQGFNEGAEKTQSQGADALDRFLALSDEALRQADDVLNRIFGLLGDFFSGEGDLQTRFDGLLQGLQEIGLINFDQPWILGEGGAPQQGTAIRAQSFNLQLEFSFSYEEITIEQATVKESDPIVFDLDGDGIELTSYQKGARFDITGSGQQVNTAFVTGGDAFLALDRNGNGTIDSGRELFGDQNGATNGFEELRKLDSNKDGVINKNDVDFAKLLLFKDNGNGKTEEGELFTLEQAGIREISLGYRNVSQVAAGGNRLGQIGSYTRNDGSRGLSADAILNYTI